MNEFREREREKESNIEFILVKFKGFWPSTDSNVETSKRRDSIFRIGKTKADRTV